MDDFLNKKSYIAFDGTSIRDIIIDRLNRGQVFTDQNYQGSNLSALIDVISYSFSTLLYYLNKTSSESLFSESQLYENMNRIVKLLNYNPVGRLGQNVPFTISVSPNIFPKNYTIPRYSYVATGGTVFSIPQDVTFTKFTEDFELIENISNTYLAYQGTFQEYKQYTALGIDNEIMFLTLPEDVLIDHFNIFVFVNPLETGIWEEWSRATDLFLYSSNDSVYEVRFNQNKNYEIKFGDNINGRSLKTSDKVQIYYLKTEDRTVGIGPGALEGTLIPFQSTTFSQIINDINIDNNYMSLNELTEVTINNDFPSTIYTEEESVDSIRKNAPKAFRSQNRLVTTSDYDTFVRSNFPSFVSDISVVDNDTFLKGHLKYLYNIGLDRPQEENRVLINQVSFANSCNFNNLYLYMVPNSNLQEYLTSPQKEIILNELNKNKIVTSRVVPMDPVYVYIDFYIENPSITPNPNDLGNTKLVITKDSNTRRADSAILADLQFLFSNSFNRNVSKLGQSIDIYQISTSILNIDGVKRVQTYRSDIDTYVEGVSLLLWNNTYPENDSQVYTQNLNLEYFQYPIFNDVENIISRVTILEVTGAIKAADF
jgi:hypothetical protein